MDPAVLTMDMASSSQKIPFKVLTANHDDGEKSKRFGYKAPTLSACFEIFLQDMTPDPIVGILLNLTPTEVQSLKSSIRHALTSSIFPQHVNIHMLSLQRELLRGRLIEFNKLAKLIRQSTVFVIGLQYPHLFKEPASYQEFQQEWNANEFGCYSRVPYTYRRELLVRLVDICAGELRRDRLGKILRSAATNPIPSNRRPAPSPETDHPPSKRPRLEVASTSNLKRELPNPDDPGDKNSAE
jgi:hypothetical protein